MCGELAVALPIQQNVQLCRQQHAHGTAESLSFKCDPILTEAATY